MRDYKAAKTRSAAETRRTAIHEAGHVVVLIALGLAFVGVSIIPDIRAATLGQVFCSPEDVTADRRARETIYPGQRGPTTALQIRSHVESDGSRRGFPRLPAYAKPPTESDLKAVAWGNCGSEGAIRLGENARPLNFARES